MKILVTGATGFMGSHIVRALLEHNHQVIILKRSFSDAMLEYFFGVFHQIPERLA